MVHVHNNEDMWLNGYGVTPVLSADSAHARRGKSLLKLLLIFSPKSSIFHSRLLGLRATYPLC